MTNHESLSIAVSLLTEGKLEEALNAFQEQVQKGENLDVSWNYIGVIHFQLQDFNTAFESWQQAIAKNPNFVEPYLSLSYLLNAQGDTLKAKDYASKAYKLAPSNPLAKIQFASSLINSYEYERALEIVKDVENETLAVDFLLLRIKALKELGRYREISSLLLRAEEAVSGHPQLLVERIDYELNTGRHAIAENLVEKGLASFPEYPFMHIQKGKILMIKKEYQNAIASLQVGIQGAPRDWSALTFLGNALFELGHFKDAIKAYEEAKSIHPTHVGIQQRLAKAYSRFVPPWHSEMLSDLARNSAFHKAIKEVVSSNDVVFEIGTGSGILSILAAKSGAKHVYGCEQLPEMAEVSLLNVERNNLQEKITVWTKSSLTVKPEQFEQRPSVLIAEVFDAGFIGEHAIPSFRHALNEVCSESCIVIPKRVQLKARLVHMPSLGALHPANELEGVDISAFDRFRIPMEYESVHLYKYDYEFCSDEFDLLTVDFKNLFNPIPEYASESISMDVTVTSPSKIHGIAFWFDLDLTDTVHLSNHPSRKDNHWGQAVFFFDMKKSFKVGENVSLEMFYNDYLIWFNELS